LESILEEDMFLHLILFCLLYPHASSDPKIKDVLSDEEHHSGGEHNAEYDHEAFLGKDVAPTFLNLSPEESKQKLGDLFHKVDGQDLVDGFITEDELKKWVEYTQKRYNSEDTAKQFKKNDLDGDDSMSWEEYKNSTFDFLEENDVDNEYHVESLKQDEKRFNLANLDDDSKLSMDEFSAFLHPEDHDRMIGYMVTETIEDMDKDSDGLISMEEYLGDQNANYIKDEDPQWLKGERDQFTETHDKNRDGKLDMAEVKEWILPHDYVTSEVKHLLKEADADGDGKISKTEMMEKHNLFVGSRGTGFEDIMDSHEEL